MGHVQHLLHRPPSLTGGGFTTALQAIKSGLLTEPYDPKALDMTLITRGMDGEDDRLFDLALVETNSTLKDELACEVIEQVIGWGSYFITKLL
ncbi:hypothetical protein EDB92DRAFT_1958239 [Lactarius akahatsu]|uniref:Uncharacterized protein n=1 Tax=Lactarius akahatsu TaxID=416441 RepID=A0AAD4L2I0_9AGAM|nr:hypothetical protein EDB92DRAFT_1958239 [Lactarius akahatsu]